MDEGVQDDGRHDVDEEGDYFLATIRGGEESGGLQRVEDEGVSPRDYGPCDGSVGQAIGCDKEET